MTKAGINLSLSFPSIDNLYKDILPNVATCIKILEIFSRLDAENKEIEIPGREQLFDHLDDFVSNFEKLQNNFIDFGMINTFVKSYENILEIAKSEECFPKELNQAQKVIQERDTWLQAQFKHLKKLSETTQEILSIEPEKLNMLLTLTSHTKAEFDILHQLITQIHNEVRSLFNQPTKDVEN